MEAGATTAGRRQAHTTTLGTTAVVTIRATTKARDMTCTAMGLRRLRTTGMGPRRRVIMGVRLCSARRLRLLRLEMRMIERPCGGCSAPWTKMVNIQPAQNVQDHKKAEEMF